jgi:hypothetical protein
VPGIRLCSLQQGAGRQDAPVIPAKDIAVTDLRRLAERIMELDLVIAVDTMVAHLAGALGARVWTMLHAHRDWRWPKTGRDSIWYPSMRLFHQPRSGDWDCVIDEIVHELGKYASRVDSADARLHECTENMNENEAAAASQQKTPTRRNALVIGKPGGGEGRAGKPR